MLTADQLDTLTGPITDLYEQYNQSVINDIARRLVKMGKVTDTAAWQMQRLTESGKVYENALKELAKTTGKSETELRKMFEDAGVKSMRFDDSIYKAAGLNPLPLNLSPAMAQVLAAGLRKTNGLVKNLTMTTAINAQHSFIQAADLAYMQVAGGAMSYDQAIRAAILNVAENGLHTINYANGHKDKLDVAMRRTVLTGVNQTTGNLQIARADEMGVDLVQTSAHIGARPAHQIWQGQIFSRSGSSKAYPDFVLSTGYGTGAGLCGWNCRHSFYPFFEGISENAYNQAELDSYANKTVTYNGKEIPIYDATQMQRGIERKIRLWKRKEGALDAGGFDNEAETAKVKEWQSRMRDFIKQTGLQRQSVREQVVGAGKAAKVVIPAVPVPVPPIVPAPIVPSAPLLPTKPVFVDANNIKEANDYAKNILGLQFAEYKGTDIRIANEWNKAIADAFDQFPKLKNELNSAGTTQAKYRQELDLWLKKILADRKTQYDSAGWDIATRTKHASISARKQAKKFIASARTTAYSVSKVYTPFGFHGIFINGKHKYDDLIKTLERCVQSGWHPIGCDTIKSVVDHEYAHQLDNMLGIGRDPEFLKLYNSFTKDEIKKGLSEYATDDKNPIINMGEFIAEAWAEYVNNPNPRPISKQFGDLLIKLYTKP